MRRELVWVWILSASFAWCRAMEGSEPSGWEIPKTRMSIGDGLVASFAADRKVIQFDEARHDFAARRTNRVADRWGWPEAAYQFDGESGHLSMAPDAVPASHEYTIAAWVKPQNDSWSYLVHFCRRRPACELAVSVLSDRRVRVGDGKAARLFSKGHLRSGHWHHVAVTVNAARPDKAKYALYVDGHLDNSSVAPYNPNAKGDVCNVGSFFAKSRFFRGSIDDVYIYRRALSASEIGQLAWDPLAVYSQEIDSRKKPTASELQQAWHDFADFDARRAESALLLMVSGGHHSVKFLRSQFDKGQETIGEVRTRQLVARLEADAFQTREQATRELSEMGSIVIPFLQSLLRESESLEVRYRLGVVISRINTKERSCFDVGDDRRQLRMLYVLERIDTREARDLIRRVARSTSRAAIRSCANAALARLATNDET